VLVPEVAAGAAAELATLRDACDRAVGQLLDARPDIVVVVGRATTDGRLAGAGGSLAAYGVPVRAGTGPPALPLAHTIGAWLLDRAGHGEARAYVGVTDDTGFEVVGRDVAEAADRVAVLAMGDGSARRTEKAPGHLDPRAAAYDADVVRAFREGPDAVRRLDGTVARDLLADGWPAWQALARAAAGRALRAEVRYDEAPYGVGYFVISWLPS
jgi:hypothetical protein